MIYDFGFVIYDFEGFMPGKQVKNWSKYHRLRKKGFSKEQAARITNAGKRKRKGK